MQPKVKFGVDQTVVIAKKFKNNLSNNTFPLDQANTFQKKKRIVHQCSDRESSKDCIENVFLMAC